MKIYQKVLLGFVSASGFMLLAMTGGQAQVATDVICTGCVDTSDIKGGAVTTGKIATGSIATTHVKNGAITTKKLAVGAVKAGRIANGAVTNSKIGTSAVDSAKILNNSVTGDDIASNSVSSFDLSNEAGADFSSGNQLISLTSTDVTVRSVGITAPTSGVVIVNASADFQMSGGLLNDVARCSITTGTSLDFTHLTVVAEILASVEQTNISLTRGFLKSAGTTTYRLVCDEFSGITSVRDSSITAIFVPTRY